MRADSLRSTMVISLRWQGLCIAAGVATWLFGISLLTPSLASAILWFAPLVVVPVGWQLVQRPTHGTTQARVHRVITLLQFPAAVLIVVSYALPQGVPSALWACPWAIVTVLMLSLAVLRFFGGDLRAADRLAVDVGLALPAVASVWLVMFRLGSWPLGYPAEIVELTAVHFHYTGFALPVLMQFWLRQSGCWPGRIALGGLLAGIPLVAMGITFSRLVELGGTVLLAGVCSLIALWHLRMATRAKSPGALVLFAASGLAHFGAMALAVVYAAGRCAGRPWLDIPTMVATHGMANSFGFALLGLLAWHLTPPSHRYPRRAVDSTSNLE